VEPWYAVAPPVKRIYRAMQGRKKRKPSAPLLSVNVAVTTLSESMTISIDSAPPETWPDPPSPLHSCVAEGTGGSALYEKGGEGRGATEAAADSDAALRGHVDDSGGSLSADAGAEAVVPAIAAKVVVKAALAASLILTFVPYLSLVWVGTKQSALFTTRSGDEERANGPAVYRRQPGYLSSCEPYARGFASPPFDGFALITDTLSKSCRGGIGG
jgi:hypothetical protein